MAALVLSVVGTAIAGPIGGAVGGIVGGIVGGMLDNVLFPKSYPSPPKITSSTYGNAIPLAYGPKVRLGCNLIWTSGWRKVTGKGAKKATSKKGAPPSYETDVMLAFAAGQLENDWCVKLVANGSCIFDSTVAASRPTAGLGGVIAWLLSHKAHKDFDSLVVYPGSFDQDPDPTYEAHVGTGNAPAYRGTAYLVINGLQGTPFGNAVPNIEAIIQAQASITLAEICCDVVERSGVDSGTVSTSGLTQAVRGFAIAAQSDGVSALQPLALCFDFDISELAGSLRFQPRGSPSLCAVISDQLAGHEGGGERPSFQWPREPEFQMPKLAALTFIDPDRDCQDNTQSAERETGTATSRLSQRVEVTLTSNEAREIADRMLWEAHIGRQTWTAATDDRLLWLEAGRTYDVEVPFGYEQVRLTKKTRGDNGVIEIEGRRDYSALYVSAAPGAAAATGSNSIVLGGPVNPPVFIEPPSSLPGITAATLLIALSGGDGTTANDAWNGCQVFVSTSDTTGDYVLAGVCLGPACMGKLTANITSGGSPLSVSTLESNGEPESISSTDAAAALMPYWVPNEYLTAETVTATGAEAFNLTTLHRGLYGTAAHSHNIGDAFVRIDPNVFSFQLPKAYIGVATYWRFVSAGETLDGATTYTYTATGSGWGTGASGKPAAPAAPTLSSGNGGVIVSGSPNAAEDNVTSYNVYRAAAAGALFGSATKVASGVGLGWTDPTAVPGTAYTYFWTANNAVGEGAASTGTSTTAAALNLTGPVTITGDLEVTGNIKGDNL